MAQQSPVGLVNQTTKAALGAAFVLELALANYAMAFCRFWSMASRKPRVESQG